MQFYCLQREFNNADPKKQFGLIAFKAADTDDANEKIEEEISTNSSQEWLMTKGELSALKKLLSK